MHCHLMVTHTYHSIAMLHALTLSEGVVIVVFISLLVILSHVIAA